MLLAEMVGIGARPWRTHERMRHGGGILPAMVNPMVVVAPYEFRKSLVGLILLVGKYLFDTLVSRILQFNFPARQSAIERTPILERIGHLQRGRKTTKFGAVVGRGLLGDELLLVNILLNREQHLVRIDWFDEIVGNLRTDGLVHDVLLLALGHHDNGRGGTHLLDFG